MASSPVWAAPVALPADSFNLTIQSAGAGQVAAAPREKGAAHNWFAGWFDGLPTDEETTVRVVMQGQNTDFKANVGKWNGLKPVVSYADPTRFETFLWYAKDDKGEWISSDVLAPSELRRAGNGTVPRQNVVAPELAGEFLSPDGRFWSAWRDLEGAETDAEKNIFSIRHSFASPRAAIAMRVLFTVGFLEQFAAKLSARALPGVAVSSLGKSREGRPLRLFRVDDPAPTLPEQQRPTILVMAREQATDHDGSWATHAMLCQLLEDTPEAQRLRRNTTWLFLPVLDPDSAAGSRWRGLIGAMEQDQDAKGGDVMRREAIAYARYFARRASLGRTLDIVLSLYMLEGGEADAHITSPWADSGGAEETEYFNTLLGLSLKKAGFRGQSPKAGHVGNDPFRLSGWCAERFGSLNLIYQLNNRAIQQPLSPPETHHFGALLGQTTFDFLWNEGGERRTFARDQLEKLARAKAASLKENGVATEAHTTRFNLLEGFYFPDDPDPFLDVKDAAGAPK